MLREDRVSKQTLRQTVIGEIAEKKQKKEGLDHKVQNF
jgi:hypothetical protein